MRLLAATRLERDRQRLLRVAALGEGMGAADHESHIAARGAPARKLLDELGQYGDRLAQQREHARRARQRAADDAVQQVLDRPREFADVAGADHAAAALERVERAPQARQCIAVERVLCPARELLLDAGELLARLLHEQRHEVRIQRGRRRGGRGGGRCRVRGGRRGLAGRGSTPAPRRECLRARLRLRHGRVLAQCAQAGLDVVEHVPGVAATALQRLHVVLERDDRVGQPLELRAHYRAVRSQQLEDVLADGFDGLDRARPAEHQQPGGQAAQQLRHLVGAGRLLLRDRRGDGLLDARQVDDALAQYGVLYVLEVGVELDLGAALARHDEPHELRVEVVLD